MGAGLLFNHGSEPCLMKSINPGQTSDWSTSFTYFHWIVLKIRLVYLIHLFQLNWLVYLMHLLQLNCFKIALHRNTVISKRQYKSMLVCYYSIAVPRVLFDLGTQKIVQPSFAFPSLYRDFYRSLGTKNANFRLIIRFLFFFCFFFFFHKSFNSSIFKNV